MWTPARLNAVLGSIVVTIGAWLVWGGLPLLWAATLALGVTEKAIRVRVIWRGRTIGAVWAWSTLLLGLTSLAWPIVTMVQIRMTSAQPSDEEMGAILAAVLFGVFSSVFWISFAYGLFRRVSRQVEGASAHSRILTNGTGEQQGRKHGTRD
jgi:hypothetical protein